MSMRRVIIVFCWTIMSVALIGLITLPINLKTQLIAGMVAVGMMILMKLFRSEGIWRLIALAFGTAIVMRYVYWRSTGTLPPFNRPEDFIPGLLLYLAEMYSVLMLAISLFVVAKPLPPRPPLGALEGDVPTVDVFIPTYNEDISLLANTMAAAKGLDYPADKITVWLLDDGGTDQKRHSTDVEQAYAAERRHAELNALCESLGVRYRTRARNEGAKAGNLNNGLKHSTGELVAVFDADHAPARDFLVETVGYFQKDPKLFLVQTPHFFLNPDPLERNLRTFEKMPSENEMFYGAIQRGLDKWNASFFCGSAALLRRSALDETKGFSGISITEDCETAIELHARGWNSVYVDKPLIAGLQPTTFASFIGQRSRWAQGMVQILRYKFPLLKKGLSFPQRLCYMSSTLFWLFPFSRTIFLISPLLYLFFDLEIFTASAGEFLAYTLTYMVVNLMMQNYLHGSFRWPWVSELYEYVQSVHLLPAVISAMINPRQPTFKVTAKEETVSQSRLSEIGLPFFLIFAVLAAGVVMTFYRVIHEPYKADVTLVVGAWNLLNLILAGCALGVVSERGEMQRSRRVAVKRRCELLVRGQWLPGTIEDVSAYGARVQLLANVQKEFDQENDAAIRFTPYADIPSNSLPVKVRNTSGEANRTAFGCLYAPALPDHHRLVADLIFANSNQWTAFQLSRRVNPGLLRGTLWLLGLSLYQTGRGLIYALRLLKNARLRHAPAPRPQRQIGGPR